MIVYDNIIQGNHISIYASPWDNTYNGISKYSLLMYNAQLTMLGKTHSYETDTIEEMLTEQILLRNTITYLLPM